MKTKIQISIILSVVLVFAASSLWAQGLVKEDTLFAHKATMEMIADGELTEAIWQQTPEISFWDLDSLDASDNTVYCRAAWDENYLYLAHTVVDEDLVWSDDDNAEWGHDGVEFYLNPRNIPLVKRDFDEAGHCHFIVTISLYVFQHPELWSPDPEPGEFAGMTETDSGYIIEVFVPLEELAIGPDEMAVGNVWGFMTGNNDEDFDGGGALQFTNTNASAAFHNTENWGYLKILDAPTSVEDKIDDSKNPTAFQLTQNYPNPFNPSTTISYNLAKAGHVKITISDVLGKEMTTLVDGHNDAGAYAVHWSGADMPSGIYLCRMQAEDASTGQRYSEVRKLLLQK